MATLGYSNKLTGVTFDDAIQKATEALKEQGFGVLTEIDVKATLKKKIDVDFRPYKILGACNPKLAHQALSADGEIGLLLPCNVTVQQVEGGILVSVISPRSMFSVVDNPDMEPIVTDADERLRKVIEGLS